jgi:hypothetical protein
MIAGGNARKPLNIVGGVRLFKFAVVELTTVIIRKVGVYASSTIAAALAS